jgi:hypothetical protein
MPTLGRKWGKVSSHAGGWSAPVNGVDAHAIGCCNSDLVQAIPSSLKPPPTPYPPPSTYRSTICSPNTKLSEVLEKLTVNKLHRIYVCDEDSVPTAVITLTDVLHRLTEDTIGL